MVATRDLIDFITEGFSHQSIGEDQFDATVGLIGILDVIEGYRASGEPRSEATSPGRVGYSAGTGSLRGRSAYTLKRLRQGWADPCRLARRFPRARQPRRPRPPGGRDAIEDVAAPATAGPPIAGKTVVFTGPLTRMTRAEAEARAEALGAKVAARSARTDYVVAGPGAGSKQKAARDLGLPILTDEEWLALVD